MSDDAADRNRSGVLRILRTKTATEKLNAALDVIEEFKNLESREEWFEIMFAQWGKLEQLEDALRLLTGRGASDVDDEIMLAAWNDWRNAEGDAK